jgi:signal transduction histidine kinase
VIGVINGIRRQARPFTPSELILLEGLGSVLGIGLANAELLEELKQKETELRSALRRAVELQEEERKRLARDLHDEAGQALTSMLIRLKALDEETDLETILARLDGLRYLTSQVIEEVHNLAVDLRPDTLDNLGVTAALRWYTRQFSERSGLAIHFSGPERLERLHPDVELTLYRAAQEGVVNAVRHGQAQEVGVSLELNQHSLRLTVIDDGRGIDPLQHHRGLGLLGIRERVELLGGAFGLDAEPGKGARLWVDVPLGERHAD